MDEATFAELQAGMASGALTARGIAEAYLERIGRVDRDGPRVTAVIELNPQALAIAEVLDEERRTSGPRGPLHGIPILLKDNIDTADRMKTSAGSLALAESTPLREAFLVQRLREAGAVLLGKANLSEWANFRSSRSTSGWSGRGGQTRNPYALDRNPSGSSSGSAVAVAAGLCAAAVGTETDGSIVGPASACGIVGIKPTVGLVSRSGVIPIAHSQDTPGPMARTVADAAILLGALAGYDPQDSATYPTRSRTSPGYAGCLDSNGLRGARLGVVRGFAGYHRQVDALLDGALTTMERLGAHLVDPADLATAGQLEESEMEVLLFEFKADLEKYLAGLGPQTPVRSLADVIAFNEAHREDEMPYFGQELFLRAQEKGPLSSPAYRKALEQNHRLARAEGIDAALGKHRLDALVAPTGGPAWLTDWVNGDQGLGGCSTVPAVAGYPHITVPAGQVCGLPVGISFFGAAYGEPALIRLAYAYEQATRHRRPPRFLAMAEVRAG